MKYFAEKYNTFFAQTKDVAQYELVMVGDYILNKYVDGNTGQCFVAIYPKEHFKNYEKYPMKKLEFKDFEPATEG